MEQIERNMGEQPIKKLMMDNNLKPHDLVEASTEFITHKMVARACKGRKLTANIQSKVLRALNKATNKEHSLGDLFNYSGE
jgi:hypothetical protein